MDLGGPNGRTWCTCKKDTHVCLKRFVLLVMQSLSPFHPYPVDNSEGPNCVFHSEGSELIAFPLPVYGCVCLGGLTEINHKLLGLVCAQQQTLN